MPQPVYEKPTFRLQTRVHKPAIGAGGVSDGRIVPKNSAYSVRGRIQFRSCEESVGDFVEGIGTGASVVCRGMRGGV